MRKFKVIGIGTGNPEHMTIQAINALNECDVLFVPTKGEEKLELATVRRQIIGRYATRADLAVVDYAVPSRKALRQSYEGVVADWHEELSAIYEELFLSKIGDGQIGGFLVWGDPSLYDSTIRILEAVQARQKVEIDFDVIPGITSMQVLTASHKITANSIGQPIQITTGRRLAESYEGSAQNVFVMLDGEQAFAKIDDLDAIIYWGAYLGMPQQITVCGKLGDVRHKILSMRREARERHGWIMDIYMLQKSSTPSDEL